MKESEDLFFYAHLIGSCILNSATLHCSLNSGFNSDAVTLKTKFLNDNLEDVYSVYAYSYLKFICNGLMGEHDMYFVDTKNVIRKLLDHTSLMKDEALQIIRARNVLISFSVSISSGDFFFRH